jgi:hypothetical protein
VNAEERAKERSRSERFERSQQKILAMYAETFRRLAG